jgi:hypothetical protein
MKSVAEKNLNYYCIIIRLLDAMWKKKKKQLVGCITCNTYTTSAYSKIVPTDIAKNILKFLTNYF